ncbi:MAG: ABC transporter permease [Candidatus Rokubacteria bacterium]|nr:ABC transporter permease [Candidatus Rokubacteria bacterium]
MKISTTAYNGRPSVPSEGAVQIQVPGRSARPRGVNFANLEKRLGGLASIAALMGFWEALSRLVLPRLDPQFAILVPPPSRAFMSGLRALLSGELLRHILASSERVLLAWSVVAVIAIPLGIAIGWWPRVNRFLGPIVEMVRPIPPIAWIPISILWFGIGMTQNVFIIMIGAFFPILINTVHGVRSIEPILIRAALNLGAPPWKLLRKVVLYGALPNIFTGLRIGLGVSWMLVVAAELVAATSGLGFMIEDARNFLRTDIIFMGMVIIGCMGILMERILRRVERALLVWYHGAQHHE